MNAEHHREEQLLAELKSTFPAMFVRPLREFGAQWTDSVGAWVGGEGDCVMSDGMAVFTSLCCPDPKNYDGTVHHDFVAWLKERGWCAGLWDYGVYLIEPYAPPQQCNLERGDTQ